MLTFQICLADIVINAVVNEETRLATVSVVDTQTQETETYTCDAIDFTKALSIAVHWDGMPDYREDSPAAERAIGKIRWIP